MCRPIIRRRGWARRIRPDAGVREQRLDEYEHRAWSVRSGQTGSHRPWAAAYGWHVDVAAAGKWDAVRIGLISDTHIPSMGNEPPPQVETAFSGVDLILHAGDVYTQGCITWLERIAPVRAAIGPSFAGTGEGAPRVSVPIVVEAEGHAIGVVHKLEMLPLGDEVFPGALAHYPAGASIAAELLDIFGRAVEIVVFGYTHEAMIETHQGVLFVNPGSPNMVKQSMRLGTVALLDLTPAGPEARIIDLTSIVG